MLRLRQHQLTVRGHSYAAYCVTLDKAGRYVITGSDDNLVKIWSYATGILQCVCRGHQQEIADLSVSCDDTFLATASVDGIIRVWTLCGEEQPLGTPVAVLKGHTALVVAVEFSPIQPHILLSSSFDGTCRIWNVRCPTTAPIILRWEGGIGLGLRAEGGGAGYRIVDGVRATRHSERRIEAGSHPQQQQQQPTGGGSTRDPGGRTRRGTHADAETEGHTNDADADVDAVEIEEDDAGGEADGEDDDSLKFVTACFSRDGQYIFAGAKDCCTYVWYWPNGTDGALDTSSGLVIPKDSWSSAKVTSSSGCCLLHYYALCLSLSHTHTHTRSSIFMAIFFYCNTGNFSLRRSP